MTYPGTRGTNPNTFASPNASPAPGRKCIRKGLSGLHLTWASSQRKVFCIGTGPAGTSYLFVGQFDHQRDTNPCITYSHQKSQVVALALEATISNRTGDFQSPSAKRATANPEHMDNDKTQWIGKFVEFLGDDILPTRVGQRSFSGPDSVALPDHSGAGRGACADRRLLLLWVSNPKHQLWSRL